MWALIDDNNRILQQIKNNLSSTNNNNVLQPEISGCGTSFSDIHNIINEERRKVNDMMNDAEF